MNKLPLIIGVILGIGALVYVTRPDVSLKLGSQIKCVSPDGRFIKGGYMGEKDKKLRLTVEITDELKPPMKIVQSGAFSEYESFKKAFDKACQTGKLREE